MTPMLDKKIAGKGVFFSTWIAENADSDKGGKTDKKNPRDGVQFSCVNSAQQFSNATGYNYVKHFPRSGIDFGGANVTGLFLEIPQGDLHQEFPSQPTTEGACILLVDVRFAGKAPFYLLSLSGKCLMKNV